MVDILKDFFGHDPELYERMKANMDRPFTFFPIATYDKVNDLFEIRLTESAIVVYPVKSRDTSSLDFDLLCDYEGNVRGFCIKNFSALKLMSPEVLAALDKYNMDRLWPKKTE